MKDQLSSTIAYALNEYYVIWLSIILTNRPSNIGDTLTSKLC